jgi:hypothetical protein
VSIHEHVPRNCFTALRVSTTNEARGAIAEQGQEIRAQVLGRARWVCQACSLRTRLDVHHVTKRAQGGSGSISTG